MNASRLSTEQLKIHIAGRNICQQLTLNIQPGEVWGVLGGNGSGKTTLLHTLAGLRDADSGQVCLNGTPLKSLSAREKARCCGILLQDDENAFPATVIETVLQGRHPHLSLWQWESADDEQRAINALRDVNLLASEDALVSELSGGERQRVRIATLITQAPDIWLMDEPTNHLDLHHQVRLLSHLTTRIKAAEQTLLMSLHDLNLAWRFCDKVILLLPDQEPCTGNTVDLLVPEQLERLYQHPIHCLDTQQGKVFVAA